MCPGGYPIQESQNWQAGFLPGIYQGTYIDTQHESIDKLIEYITNERISNANQRKQLDFVQKLNRRHQAARDADPQLEERIQSFELRIACSTKPLRSSMWLASHSISWMLMAL